MDSLTASLASGGVLGAAARYVSDPSLKREMFTDSGTAGAVLFIFFILMLIAFTVMLCYSIYKIVPVNKGLHLVGSIFLGGLWYVPLLFYYGYNNYELRK